MQNRVHVFKNIAHITSSELYDLEFTRKKLKLFKSKLKISHLVTIQETQICSIWLKNFYLRWEEEPEKSRFFSIVELIYEPEGTHSRKSIHLAALDPLKNIENTPKLELMFDKQQTESLYQELTNYSISPKKDIPEPTYLEGALDESLPARQKYLDANREKLP